MAFRDKGKADELRIDALEETVEDKEAEIARLKAERDAEVAKLKEDLEEARNPAVEPKESDQAKKPKPKQNSAPLIAAGVAILVAATGMLFAAKDQSSARATKSESSAPARVAGEKRLKLFTFLLDESSRAALFHAGQEPTIDVKFAPRGLVESATISKRAMQLRMTNRYDHAQAASRMNELAPHRFDGQTIPNFDATFRLPASSGGELSIGVSIKGDSPREILLADALWATARYAIYGEERPTPKQLGAVNGPTVGALAWFDATTAIEGAADYAEGLAPYRQCKTSRELTTKLTRLRCAVYVNHPFVEQVVFEWPNHAASTLANVTLKFRRAKGQTLGSRDHAGSVANRLVPCLEKPFPKPGKPHVVDHATGESVLVWDLGMANKRGVLRTHSLSLGSTGPDVPGKTDMAWAKYLRPVFAAVDKCSR